MEFFHERLKSARKMNGLSLQLLADKLGTSLHRQSLHKYETGQMNPDSSVINELCKVLHVRPDYFYKNASLDIGDVSFRKLAKCSTKEQDKVKEKTIDFLERYLELEELLGIHYKKNNLRHTIKVSAKSEIDQKVTSLRKSWNLGSDSLYNVVELLEDKGIKVVILDADNSFDGLSTWVNNKIPVIVINKHGRSKDRIRFTALHELGHLVLDIEDLPEKDQEKYCHYFAASMLMPKETMFFELGENRTSINFKELGLIKIQYGLSIQSLLFRAKDLNIISERTFKSNYAMISRLGWRKKEPYDYEGTEGSNRFDQLILRGVSEGVITSSKAAALKNMKLSTFRKYLTSSHLA